MSIFIWTLWFILAEFIIFAVQFFFRKKELKTFVYIILAVVKIILGIGLAVLVMAGPLALRPVQPIMAALYVALFMDGFADIIFCFFKKKITSKRLLIRKIVSLVLGIVFFTYGTVNMQMVTPSYQSYSSDKLENEYRFVYLADMHVGSAQSFETTEKTIQQIKNENADFVVLGGDITDDYTSKEEMQKTFALFKDFGAPVFYVYGNHDRQENADYAHGRQYTVEELENTLTENGIKILKDEFVQIADDLVILGREDMSEESRKDAGELISPKADAYLVTFDHQPFDKEGIEKANADLQYSGHTHAGQFFPLKPFYNWFIGDAFGEYQHGNTTVYVSPGVCGWRVPFRTDGKCTYEVAVITPAA
ncbi:MAG: metallophosphoesterase [Clostridia bacterium]|nr:metallophosphoesterase [Clostridia bacterium]